MLCFLRKAVLQGLSPAPLAAVFLAAWVSPASAAPLLVDRVFAKSVPEDVCERPAAEDHFTSSDSRIHYWVTVAGVQAGDVLTTVYTLPGGRTERVPFRAFTSAGTYCARASIPLSAFSSQDQLVGDWQFRFLVNQATIGEASTTLIGPNQPRIDSIEVYGNPALSRLSPGALAIVHGANLASGQMSAPEGPLPETLGGARATVNGIPAPIFRAGPSELHVQIPAALRADSVAVRVFTGAGGSNPYRMGLTTVSPSLLPHPDQNRQAQMFRFGADGRSEWVSAQTPLRRGDTAVLVAAGLGATAHPPRDGHPGFEDSSGVFMPQVAIGGVKVRVEGSFLSGFPGAYWVYIKVPPEIPSGAAVPVRLSVNGIAANVLTVPVAGPGPEFPAIRVSRVEHPPWNGPNRDNGVYNPASLVTMTASNLRPNAAAFLLCTGANGFEAKAPVITISADAATAIVPPYIDPRTGDYVSGQVMCRLGQRLADQTALSGTFQFRIQAPPAAQGPPGRYTQALLEAAAQGAQRVHANLTLKDRAAGGHGYSAANTRAEMQGLVEAYAPFVDAIRRIKGGASTVTLGTSATGKTLSLAREDLARTDRWIAMILAEARASTANNESYLTGPGRPVHTLGVRQAAEQAPAASIFGRLTGFARECLDVFGHIDYALNGGRDPAQACGALRSFTEHVPAAFGAAVFETGEAVAQDAARFMKIGSYVVMAGVAPEAKLAEVITRVGVVSGAVEAGSAFFGNLLMASSPYSDEQRQEMMARARDTWQGYIKDAADDVYDNLAEEGLRFFFGEFGPEAYKLPKKLENWANQANSLIDKVAGNLAEAVAPYVMRNGDGSISLNPEKLPGRLNVVRGVVSRPEGAVTDGFVELGDGGRLTTPVATGATGPNGAFEMLVPADQVGVTIPPSASVFYNVPRPGSFSYQVFTGRNPVGVGQSTVNLPAASVNPNGGGGGGGSDCSAGPGACPAN
jgi:uncharacterized protein (TIGR03437 family)